MDFLFPHEKYRKIQQAFMNQVYTTIKNKDQLLVHAPTGIGKTASVISPALTYLLEEKKSKVVFFLTSRTTQHLIAVETLKKIKEKFSIPLIIVDLIGKKNMCNQPNSSHLRQGEFLEHCKYLRERNECPYYENVKSKGKLSIQALETLKHLKENSPMHIEQLNEINFSNDLCSYEIATLLGKEALFIIADYNYMLNPLMRTSLLNRINKNLSNCIIIFDEGHNVPKRAKETFTNNLSTFILDNAIKETNSLGFKELADDIQSIKGTMETLSKKISLDKQEVLIEKKEFFNEIEKISSYEELQGSLAFAASQIMENKKRSFTQFIALFMESWLGPEEGFARILSRGFLKSGKPVITLSYKCLDPSIAMSELIRESHAMIFMSGTLTPLDMYADLLGTQKEKLMQIEYLNPFPQENRLNIIVPDTSTKYTQRNPKMYEAIAEKCSSITNIVPGNTIIFFPSYHVLNEVYNYFQKISEKTMLLEDPNHGKEQRSNLLERFKGFKDTGSVLLGVAGGSFAEGIDLPGDLLKCVIVVGLPLTKPNLETQEQITYYDKRFSKGWDYGYIIPALIKTLQSAGRCIRSETDRGVIVFMDERYTWQNYKKCFSSDMNIKIEKNPEYLIKQFFENHKPY